jgi:type II secretory ATPase GspE/PulE/Tfp pilus assembly ATPase PilB-like protein
MQKLEELGFSEEIIKAFLRASAKPNGLILNTGPTGSGKTTTLYAILNILNKPDKKIITIEDPVEYKLPNVVQVQISEKITFASGLRSILRHDPDIIMVGEIRDKETAQIAIQASLTGHLVLSTLHTNNAAGAFIRLLDLGIEPFLLAGNVNLVIAQRLVRRICPYCKTKKIIPEDKKIIYKNFFKLKELPSHLWEGRGCEYCHATGFMGRIAIGEVIEPSFKLNQLLQTRPTADSIEELVLKEGMRPMVIDGWLKVISGITTPEEVISKTSF